MNFRSPSACRLCSSYSLKSILNLDGMPSRAQYFPHNSNEAKLLVTSLNLSQCSQCGLVQIPGAPVAYYREVIRSNKVSTSIKHFRYAQLQNFIRKYSLSSSLLLEVGCGNGDILEILRELDCNFHGMEINQDFLSNLQKEGYTVFSGYPDATNNLKIERLYDAFFSFNVLEHAPNIREFLLGIQKMLEPGAVGIIEVPNFDMIASKNMISEFMLEHLVYFNQTTLRLALETSGFEILEMKEVWHGYIISSEVKFRQILNLNEGVKQWNELKKEIGDLLSNYSKSEICIWGAGHQSLATISILQLQDRVGLIVDSSKNKQGTFAPSSGIAIMSPEVLKTSRSIRCVLVMGGSYTKEISDDLLANFPSSLRIFTIDGVKLVEIK